MTVAAALELLTALLAQTQNITALITAAHTAGQTTLAPEAWLTILKADSDARAALVAALSAK